MPCRSLGNQAVRAIELSLTSQSARRSPRRRPIRCPSTEQSIRAWCARAATERPAGSLCADKSTSPWFASSSVCRRLLDRDQAPQPSSRGFARTAECPVAGSREFDSGRERSSDLNPACLIPFCTASRLDCVISNCTGRWVLCCITTAREALGLRGTPLGP